MHKRELRGFLLDNVPMDMINEMQYWEETKAFRKQQELLALEKEAAEKQKLAIEIFKQRSKGRNLSWKEQVKLIEKIVYSIYPYDGAFEEKRGPIYEALLEYLHPEIKPGDWKRCLTR